MKRPMKVLERYFQSGEKTAQLKGKKRGNGATLGSWGRRTTQICALVRRGDGGIS